ncbi:hypothetical protein PG993_011934 [Apiospora rasikravindrae]|uniref:Uncharacterized protein n=1 Tax=Apiospora rasikravindrae TaxID=990691 RepID=A0ABR1S150_9PEZI
MRNYSVEDDGSSVSRKRRRPGDRSSTHSSSSSPPSQSPRIAAASTTTATAATSPASGGPADPTLRTPESRTIPAAAAQATPTKAGAAQSFQWHFDDAMQRSSSGGTVGIHHFAMPSLPTDWSAFSGLATPSLSTPVVASPDWDHHDLTMTHIFAAENTDKSSTTSFNSPSAVPMPRHAFPATHIQQALQLQQPHTPDSMPWLHHQPEQEHKQDCFTHGNSYSTGMFGYQFNELESRPHDHMEILTNLNLELVTQLKQVTQSNTNLTVLMGPTSGDSGPSNTSILEHILSMTQEFLNILDIVAGAPHTPHTPYTPLVNHAAPMAWSGGLYGNYASGSESAPGSCYDSDMNSPSDSTGITQYSPGSASMSPQLSSSTSYFDTSLATTAPTTDSATVLLVITCYVHILRLHVALFWHIQQDLQRSSDSNKTQGVCQFGNIPLQSGNLQITMVIQLVTNAFERMEAILGLPSELCLHSNASDDGLRQNPHGHGSLLGDEGLLDVARTIIGKEDAGRPEEGKGGIQSLCGDILKTRDLLRRRTAT